MALSCCRHVSGVAFRNDAPSEKAFFLSVNRGQKYFPAHCALAF